MQQATREREPLPERIQNAPQLQQGLALYFNAFVELQSTRPIGFSAGGIPWTAIVDWGRFYRLDDDQIEDLVFYVQRMDDAFLVHLRDKESK